MRRRRLLEVAIASFIGALLGLVLMSRGETNTIVEPPPHSPTAQQWLDGGGDPELVGITSAAPPPLPVSTTQTNLLTGSTPAPTNFVDVISIEFSPICKNVETNISNGVTNVWHCGHTNRYRLSIQREDLPEFWFTMPVQTSTNLVDWVDKDIAIGLPADKAAEFFRPSTNDLRTIDPPKREPVAIVFPTAAEE